MFLDVTIKNYRSFSDSNPARVTIRDGFTALVGPNNSGKSSILRFFYELRDLIRRLSIGDDLEGSLRYNRTFNRPPEILDLSEMFCKFNHRDIEIVFETHGVSRKMDLSDPQVARRFEVTIPRNTNTWRLVIDTPKGRLGISTGSHKLNGSILEADDIRIDLADYLAMFSKLAKSLYIPAFRNAINLGSAGNFYDIQTGQAFIQAWRALKTGNSRRDNEAAADVTESIRLIFGYDRLEINSSEDNTTLQVLIDGRSYGLHELGSGFTQFALTLINAATTRPSYVLIDEPELNLHATLQLQFLTTLGSFAGEGVLFATHSVGLARAAAEFVYSLTSHGHAGNRIQEFGAEPRLPELLGELSFSSYRELGCNGILLVEGSTDIKLFHELLRKYSKDQQFVVLPLGGDQLARGGVETELEEIKRISHNIFAVVDSERKTPGSPLLQARQDFVEICARVGITYHVLERRAVENYFSDGAVKRALGDEYHALGPYDVLREAENGWPKSSNWRIAREMTSEELNDTDLGRFLQSI